MDFIKDLFKSLALTILSVYWIFVLSVSAVVQLKEQILNFSYSLDKITYLGLCIFCTLFCIGFSIAFGIKAIYYLIRSIYYGFFHNNNYDKMEIKINEENMIQESYIQFKNGDILPISISRIVAKVPPKEETEEKKDE